MKRKKIFIPLFTFIMVFIAIMNADFIPVLAASPNVTSVVSLPGVFSQDPTVTMGGNKVSAIRYVAIVDGIEYEAYCADRVTRS
jgi:F0F1-type ATP synthase membrane subunit a